MSQRDNFIMAKTEECSIMLQVTEIFSRLGYHKWQLRLTVGDRLHVCDTARTRSVASTAPAATAAWRVDLYISSSSCRHSVVL